METKSKLVYTDKIEDGVLRLTDMEVGTAVTGIISATGIAKYGPTVTLKMKDGKDVLVYLAGSAKKFFDGDSSAGKYSIGNRLTLVRKENYTLKNGFSTSQFVVSSTRPDGTKVSINNGSSTSSRPAVSQGLTKRQEIEAKLKAQRN